MAGLLEQDFGAICASCLKGFTDNGIKRFFKCVTLEHKRHVRCHEDLEALDRVSYARRIIQIEPIDFLL